VLLSAMLGLLTPFGGSLDVEGVDPAKDPIAARRRVCYVPPQAPTWSHLSVVEHVRFVVSIAGDAAVSARDVVKALRISELPDRLMGQRCRRLTQYERLCVWLAIHRLRGTSVLLRDDPAATLPERLGRSLSRLLREMVTEGRSVVVTARYPGLATELAQTAFRIEQGRLVLHTAPLPDQPAPVTRMLGL
jgi:ABC-2 type transport system ATP-binding protein